MESTKLQWNGDVDLNDGKLQEQYQAYRKRLASIADIGAGNVLSQLSSVLNGIKDDLNFINSGN